MKGIKISVSWRAVLLALGIGIVTMVSTCAGAAGLMAAEVAGTESIGLFAAGILVLSGLSGGLAVLLDGGGAVDAVLVAAGELVVLLGVNLALNGGQMERVGVTMLALLGGSGAALLLRLGKGSGGSRRRRSRRKL